jgi:hypothetical protein
MSKSTPQKRTAAGKKKASPSKDKLPDKDNDADGSAIAKQADPVKGKRQLSRAWLLWTEVEGHAETFQCRTCFVRTGEVVVRKATDLSTSNLITHYKTQSKCDKVFQKLKEYVCKVPGDADDELAREALRLLALHKAEAMSKARQKSLTRYMAQGTDDREIQVCTMCTACVFVDSLFLCLQRFLLVWQGRDGVMDDQVRRQRAQCGRFPFPHVPGKDGQSPRFRKHPPDEKDAHRCHPDSAL